MVLLFLESAFLMRRQERAFAKRLADQDAVEEERRVALYKQQKATATAVAQSDRAVRKLVDQVRDTHENTRQLQRQVDSHFAHPQIKRLIDREGDNRG